MKPSLALFLFHLLTRFDGRIGLRAFWLGNGLIALALLGVEWAASRNPGLAAERAAAFAQAFALFPWAALAAKRAADRGGAPLFGILLVCAIVLPGQLVALMPVAWTPSLRTISLIAWLAALVDLGLLPGVSEASGARQRAEIATAPGAARPAA